MGHRLSRAERHLERRAASVAARHVKLEHVDGVLRALARGLQRHVTDLATVDPDSVDNETLDAFARYHAAKHPSRALPPPTAEQRPSLARAQDLAAPWSTGKTTETK